MASYTIQKRKTASGDLRYTAVVRVKKLSKVVYRESRTFSKHTASVQWGKARVNHLEVNGYSNSNTDITLGEMIQKYLDDPHVELKRTKLNVLRLLTDCDIAQVKVVDLQSHHIIEHCKLRKSSGTGKSTISHDVSYIRGILKIAKPFWGIDTNDQCVVDAYPVLHELQLTGKSEKRSRRPTDKEIDLLKEELGKRAGHQSSLIPFVDILDFSILSCMRIGEVCSITWEDVDINQKAVLVRNRKDPRKKEGNHMLVPMLGGAWEILNKQPKTNDKVFPYKATSVTAGFQRVRNKLGITNLRYHDLRREGASRLFEKGYTIDEVAQVTGHRNINTLWQVYTELFPSRLHDKDKTDI
jgi:integrase